MRLLFAFALAFFWIVPAYAISEETGDGYSTRTLADYIAKYVDVPAGATDWKVFGKTKEIEVAGRDKDGMDFEYQKPGFTDEVKKLDGKTVRVKGFMFPLEEDEDQHEFLFGPFPVSCPFHYHVGPALVIEVHTDKDKPVPFSYDPVTIEGTLELVPLDTENSTFYRLRNAQAVKG